MTSAQVSWVLATVGAAFLAQSIACALLFRRVRALTLQISRPEPTPDNLGKTQSIEARLARLEAGGALQGPGRKGGAVSPGSGELKRRRLDRRQVASSDGPVLIAVPSLASTPSSTSTEASEEFDRRFGAIWALSDSGTPLDQIAQVTGYPVGQVELILGLRRPRNRVDGTSKESGSGGSNPVRGEIDV